jgi:hypothetical protein
MSRVNIAASFIHKQQNKIMDFKKIAIGFVVAAAGTLVALFLWSKVQEHKIKKTADAAKKEIAPTTTAAPAKV